jgi:hypothetical protein
MKNNNSQKNQKSRNDIILAVVIVLIAAAGLLLFVFNREQGSTVSVKIDGTQIASYPLAEDREIPIKTGDNDEHINVLVIKDGKASISEADCPDKICVETRAVSYVGETVVCLPHKLVIEITNQNADGGIDVAV